MLPQIHPIVRASLTSGVSMSCGAAICQALRGVGSGTQLRDLSLDFGQVGRFGLIGLTLHGPFFYRGFAWLESTFGPAATLRQALLKTAAGQVTLFPLYLSAFFLYSAALEGLAPADCLFRAWRSLPPALASGTLFWPAVNVVNFMVVPPAQRVPYVAVAGVLWNASLAYMDSAQRGGTQQGEQGQEQKGARGKRSGR